MAETRFDCFLAHNAADKPAVEELAHRLRHEKLEPWLDTWNLIPGSLWQEEIEKALTACETCVVFVGPSGLGPWQHEEMRVAIQRRVDQGGFRVIPVLLPGASRDRRGRLPGFLLSSLWIEFQRALDDAEALRRLVCGIRGVAPGPGADGPIIAVESPYVGLRTFQAANEKFFFGREAATEWLISRLRPGPRPESASRFLAVVGASGSGKSSLVRAGLLPALARGALPGSAEWPLVVLRPGDDPIESLAVALMANDAIGAATGSLTALVDELASDERRLHRQVRLVLHGRDEDARVVVVVDQFEEVFTLCTDERRRSAFIDGLLYASGLPGGQTIVILTMRADFYGKCAAYARLTAALSDDTELVSPMSDDEMRSAIERPAQLVGAEMESGLTELLLEHIRGRTGALPLLQHALLALWQRRSGRLMTLDAYRAMGELDGALEQHAEAVFAALSQAEQDTCQRLLLRLIQPGAGTEDTRRRARRDELGDDDAVDDVLARLADVRLLTTEGTLEQPGAAHIEISHEALIRGWSRLRAWIEDSREALMIQHRLTEASREWEARRQSADAEDYLYRGARLAELEEWAEQHGKGMNESERAFVDASVELRNREARQQQEMRERELTLAREKADTEVRATAQLRVRARLLAVVSALALAGAVIATISFFQARDATIQARNATLQARNATLQASNATLQERAASLEVTVASTKLKEQLEREASVSARQGGQLMESAPLLALHYFLRAIELAPKAAAIGDRRRVLHKLAQGQELQVLLKHEGPVIGAEFSEDGSRIITWSQDGAARVWNAVTGEPLTLPMNHDSDINAAKFSENELRILSRSNDGTARVWNTVTGEPLSLPIKHQATINGAKFSEDKSRILTWSDDGTARVWNAVTGKPLSLPMKHQTTINGAKFSGDESLILTWGDDGTARVWNTPTDKHFLPALNHQGKAWSLEYSADESRLLTWSGDGTARVWNTPTGEPLILPVGHKGSVGHAKFSEDKSRILTWSSDGTARVWNAVTGEPLTLPMKHHDNINGAKFNQDESRILTWSKDGAARVWNAVTGEPLTLPINHDSDINGVEFSENESRILTWCKNGTARVWNAVTGEPLTLPMKHENSVRGAKFSADESRILTWSWDETARVWNAATGEPLTPAMKHEDSVWGAKFSEDESRLLTWSWDGTTHLWNAATGKPLTLPQPVSWPTEKLPLHYQVRTGVRLKAGQLEVIPPKEWLIMKSEYDQIARDLAQAQTP